MGIQKEFFEAIKSGRIAVLQGLMDGHPDLIHAKYEGSLSPILLAMYYDYPDIARWLVERGFPLDIFSAAAIGGRQDLENMLNESPDLVNAVAHDGFQPLGLACFFGNLGAAEELIERGARINEASHNSMQVMPLHSAVAKSWLKIAELLLNKGAHVNARQIAGFTPLHAAAQNGNLEMVELLVSFGAQIDALSSDGSSALDLAIRENHSSVAEYLYGRMKNTT